MTDNEMGFELYAGEGKDCDPTFCNWDGDSYKFYNGLGSQLQFEYNEILPALPHKDKSKRKLEEKKTISLAIVCSYVDILERKLVSGN